MNIFGRDMGKNEIIKRVGDISPFGGIKSYEFSDGQAKRIKAVDLKTKLVFITFPIAKISL